MLSVVSVGCEGGGDGEEVMGGGDICLRYIYLIPGGEGRGGEWSGFILVTFPQERVGQLILSKTCVL